MKILMSLYYVIIIINTHKTLWRLKGIINFTSLRKADTSSLLVETVLLGVNE